MRKYFVRVLLAVAIVAGLGVSAIPQSARATEGAPLTCTLAAATTTVKTVGSIYNWTINGAGSCINPATTSTAVLTVTGSSQGLGACDGGPVGNLELSGVLTLTSTNTGLIRAIPVRLFSPITTYPVVTAFLIQTPTGFAGAGTLFTHIFLACPPLGAPASTVVMEILL